MAEAALRRDIVGLGAAWVAALLQIAELETGIAVATSTILGHQFDAFEGRGFPVKATLDGTRGMLDAYETIQQCTLQIAAQRTCIDGFARRLRTLVDELDAIDDAAGAE